MRYRTLGRTGIKVSPFALGALALGTSIGNADVGDSVRIIHQALDAGINFLDTSDAYGESEVVVGQALRGRRDNVVLATKFSRPTSDDPNHQGASRRWIVTAVENSLRRLQTDYIDLYQVHRPDPATDIEETLSALSDLIHSGKVRAIGTSALPASDIVEAQWVAERRGLERFRTDQPPYSILNRGIEREVLPVAQRYGMGILVWGPLGQGILTGRVRKGQQSDLRRAHIFRHLGDERRIDVVEQLIPLAEKAGLPLTHLALAFTISHPGVTSAIIGPHTTEQLDDGCRAVDRVREQLQRGDVGDGRNGRQQQPARAGDVEHRRAQDRAVGCVQCVTVGSQRRVDIRVGISGPRCEPLHREVVVHDLQWILQPGGGRQGGSERLVLGNDAIDQPTGLLGVRVVADLGQKRHGCRCRDMIALLTAHFVADWVTHC